MNSFRIQNVVFYEVKSNYSYVRKFVPTSKIFFVCNSKEINPYGYSNSNYMYFEIEKLLKSTKRKKPVLCDDKKNSMVFVSKDSRLIIRKDIAKIFTSLDECKDYLDLVRIFE